MVHAQMHRSHASIFGTIVRLVPQSRKEPDDDIIRGSISSKNCEQHHVSSAIIKLPFRYQIPQNSIVKEYNFVCNNLKITVNWLHRCILDQPTKASKCLKLHPVLSRYRNFILTTEFSLISLVVNPRRVGSLQLIYNVDSRLVFAQSEFCGLFRPTPKILELNREEEHRCLLRRPYKNNFLLIKIISSLDKRKRWLQWELPRRPCFS